MTGERSPITRAALRVMDRTPFVDAFGGVFENTPSIAAAAFARGPFESREDVYKAMVAAMRGGGRECQLSLIRAHPDLAGRAAVAGELTAESAAEQSSAGLDRCTPEEFARLGTLNAAYRKKFGFPFIMAVKGKTRRQILAAFAARLENDPAAEFQRALDEIAEIARLRLADLVED